MEVTVRLPHSFQSSIIFTNVSFYKNVVISAYKMQYSVRMYVCICITSILRPKRIFEICTYLCMYIGMNIHKPSPNERRKLRSSCYVYRTVIANQSVIGTLKRNRERILYGRLSKVQNYTWTIIWGIFRTTIITRRPARHRGIERSSTTIHTYLTYLD